MTGRRTFILIVWLVLVFHCCLCQFALASLDPSSHLLCGGSEQAETCEGCPACTTVSIPKIALADVQGSPPVLDLVPLQLFFFLHSLALASKPPSASIEAPSLQPVFFESLDICPNAPPFTSATSGSWPF